MLLETLLEHPNGAGHDLLDLLALVVALLEIRLRLLDFGHGRVHPLPEVVITIDLRLFNECIQDLAILFQSLYLLLKDVFSLLDLVSG